MDETLTTSAARRHGKTIRGHLAYSLSATVGNGLIDQVCGSNSEVGGKSRYHNQDSSHPPDHSLAVTAENGGVGVPTNARRMVCQPITN